MVCDPEFSGTKVRYGCDSYDPSGTAGYHIRAYWTSGCDKQNHRKRLVNRPRTSQIPVRGQFLNNGIRTDRISTDNHIWRKYRSYGSDKSIQRPCNRRGCGSVYYLFICWEIVDDDPDNSGTGYRRNLVPLYGMIGASGLRILVDSRVDYGRSRNLMLTSIVFVTGLSGISVNIGTVSLTGMVLACVVAMALSLIFYILDKLKLTNDREA